MPVLRISKGPSKRAPSPWRQKKPLNSLNAKHGGGERLPSSSGGERRVHLIKGGVMLVVKRKGKFLFPFAEGNLRGKRKSKSSVGKNRLGKKNKL